MVREETMDARQPLLLVARMRDYTQLMKPNLSLMIVFSSVVGYLMAPGMSFGWREVLLLSVGGMLVTSSANTINQIIERNSDRFMKRTALRPLPDGRMGTTEAWIIVFVSAIAGVSILGYSFNWASAALSLLSLLLYGFAYTPLKKIHPIATFVGALPGALPPLIGWVAATGSIFGDAALGGWVLFLIQFFWQFPHFWAIAWVGYDDYLKAGIRMLPSREGKTRFTGLQCMFYSIVLIPLVAFPRMIGMSGNAGMWVSMLAGVGYFAASVVFYQRNDHASAKRLMFTSFIYLPTVLLALLFSKI